MKIKQSNKHITVDNIEESSNTTAHEQAPFEVPLEKKTPRSFWQDLHYWWTSTTFVPRFLSGPWRHPVVGYLAAFILQTLAIGSIALLAPSFHFTASVALLIALSIAYVWGTGASFVATIVGTILLVYWILVPRSSFTITNIEDLFGVIIYAIGGWAVGVLISQLRRARHAAEIEMGAQMQARKQVEELVHALEIEKKALRESEERSRTITELVSDYAYAFRIIDGKSAERAWMTEAVERITGFSTEEWDELGWEHFFHPDDQRLVEERQAVLRTGKPDIREWRVYTRSGEYRWLRDYCRPVQDPQSGQLTWLYGAAQDITERRNLMHDLAANATQLDSIFEAMTDGVVFYDSQGYIVRKNQAYSRLIGLDSDPTHLQLTPKERGEMLDLRDEQGNPIPDKQQPVQRMLLGEVFVAGKAMDIQLRALDGKPKQLNITGTALYDQAQNLSGGVLIFRDVTSRRMLERQTQEALEALLMMAEELVKLPDQDEDTDQQQEASVEIAQQLVKLICQVMRCKRVGITAYDERTQVLRLLATSGLSAEEARMTQEDAPGSRLRDILAGTPFVNAIRSQEVVMVDFSQPPLRDRPNPYGIRTMLLVPMRIGSRLVGIISLDNGSEEHHYSENECTFAKAVGDLVALIIERESLLAQRAEAHANELAAREATVLMEEFLGIAGHELRTPLTTIKAGIQLSKRHITRFQAKDVAISEEVSSVINAIKELLIRTERQVGLQNRLINDLLDVSRIQTGKLELHPELIDIAQLMQQVVEDQHDLTPERTLRYTATVASEYLVFADSDRLRQVITNYLSNALKYSAADKPVDIYISHFEHSVRVSVKDEGSGLTIEQQKRIWERFYRAPGVEVKSGSSVGLGLGLHISRMIIERQGGHVGVESTPGQGSTFWFTLPLAE